MARYVARRPAEAILVLAGASIALFACLFVLPGDPFSTLGGDSGKALDPRVRATLEAHYGLDRPVPEQYRRWVTGLARGDLGESIRLKRPVREVLGAKARNTMRLAVAALAIEVLIGATAGVGSAVLRRSFWDVAITLATTLAVGLPTLVVGLVLQEFFALRLHWLPHSGAGGGLRSLLLPAATLAAVDAAVLTRLVRGATIEELRADYVRTARAKGLSGRRVVVHHALRNALLPALTYLGIAFGSLLGGALVTEVVFGWDGLGSALVTAIAAHDNPIVIAVVTYSVAGFVGVNLAVDLAYAWLDPRIRLR